MNELLGFPEVKIFFSSFLHFHGLPCCMRACGMACIVNRIRAQHPREHDTDSETERSERADTDNMLDLDGFRALIHVNSLIVIFASNEGLTKSENQKWLGLGSISKIANGFIPYQYP